MHRGVLVIFFVGIVRLRWLACAALVLSVVACGSSMQGNATWYGERHHGRRTASGEVFDMNGYTAAHNGLAFGTRVRVTHARTGRSVVVRINDRKGSGGSIIDLSKAAAARIGLIREGRAEVKLTVLGR